MICYISWNKFNQDEWRNWFKKIRKTNLLQSISYTEVLCRIHDRKLRRGVIEIDGQAAGLVQILESRHLKGLIHGLVLDRGPLWFEGFGTGDHIEAFFRAFDHEFPRRPGRLRRVIPEIKMNDNILTLMDNIGYKRVNLPGYETIWLDLDKDASALEKAMNLNWRRSLKKAQNSGLRTDWDWGGRHLPWFLKIHGLDKAKRRFGGPEPYLVQALAENFAAGGNMMLGRALMKDRAVAALLILCHGSAATYQAGWNGEEGRALRAHHLLFREACDVLKEKGVRDFDLGGVNDEKAAGVKQFKMGMGGELVQLVGHYR